MKLLLGTICAVSLAMPLTLTASATPVKDAVAHCGKEGCKKKDGCKCKDGCKKKKKDCDKEKDA